MISSFFTTTPLFYQTLLFYWKILNPLFLVTFQKLKPPLYKGWGVPTMTHFPSQHFFENLFAPAERGEEIMTKSYLQCYIKRIQAQETRPLNKEKSY